MKRIITHKMTSLTRSTGLTRSTSLTRSASLAILALLVWSVAANAQNKEQIKKFNKEREAYFNEQLELSSAEKKAFWPVYNDFTKRKMKVIEEERNTFRYSHENAENLSDEEINEILTRIRSNKEQVFQLEQEYYKNKFPSVLPPEKVLKLYKVEWDFRRFLVKKIRGGGHGPGHGSGPGSGPGSGQGQDPGFGPGSGPGSGSGQGQGQGPGSGSGQGQGPGAGPGAEDGPMLPEPPPIF